MSGPRLTRRALLGRVGALLPMAPVLGTMLSGTACGTAGAQIRMLPEPVPAGAADVALTPRPERDRSRTSVSFDLAPYRGLGCWIDVFDWSMSYRSAPSQPAVGPHSLAALAARGVRTVYLQTARYDRPDRRDDLLEPDRLWAMCDAAHAAGMRVVGWYLPTHVDADQDLRRVLRIVQDASFDGLALDIESRMEPDVGLRNRRVAELVAAVRAAVGPAAVLGAVVVPPTTMQDVNPDYWPGFDWAMLAEQCGVFLPMNYWTNRLASSPWRDAGASSAENIRRLRVLGGRADQPVHVVGGIASLCSAGEVEAMVAAVRSEGAIGASLYDLATTPEQLWPPLAALG